MLCTVQVWLALAVRPVSWFPTANFLVNGKKVNVPSYRVSQYDIIDVRDKSRTMLWFEEATENLVDADKVIPAWLQVVPSTLRILVHQLPERAQIDVPLQEQLIVELYSK